ncbi:hypothetical protein D3C81_1311690 [compost metagenome]
MNDFFNPTRIDAWDHPGKMLEVLPSGQIAVNLGILYDRSHATQRQLRFPLHIVSTNVHLTGRWADQVNEHADRRRFTGPVRSQEPENLPGIHLEIHFVYDPLSADFLLEPLYLQYRLALFGIHRLPYPHRRPLLHFYSRTSPLLALNTLHHSFSYCLIAVPVRVKMIARQIAGRVLYKQIIGRHR